ncbi:MAG: hypothetical protein ACLFPV_02770 [Spirochaetaceae bacterium]
MRPVEGPAYLYFNGEIRPVDAPLFTGTDLGVLRGYGIFDFFRIHRGIPLYFDDYLVLTGGSSADGMSPGAENFMILLHPPSAAPGELKGAKVLTCRHQREFPEAKTTNYLTAVQGRPRLKAAGAVGPVARKVLSLLRADSVAYVESVRGS